MTPEELEKFAAKRARAKEMTAKIKKLYLNGKLGVIIDSTAHDYKRIAKEKKEMEDAGYDTFMIFVNTSLDVAQANNLRRDRKLDPKIVEDSWKDVQKNIGGFQSLFGSDFVVVDNSDTLDEKQAAKKFGAYVRSHADKWAKSPIKNPIGKQWVKDQQKLKSAGVK